MGKTHSKPLAARHGRGTAWARHAMCESVLKGIFFLNSYSTRLYVASKWYIHLRGCNMKLCHQSFKHQG